MTRRTFLFHAAAGVSASAWLHGCPPAAEAGSSMTMDLAPGRIGVEAPFPRVVELAERYGFTSVAADLGYIEGLSPEARAALPADLAGRGLVWGAADLPVDFRGEEARFEADLAALPARAAALEEAGVTRIGTYLMPMHATLPYEPNRDLHARRLGAVADVLGERGLRLGLEYVGTPSLRARQPEPFVHSLAQTQELIQAIGTGNVGLVLDAWHWFTAQESPDDIAALDARDVVAVDLNDAPAGVPLDEQQDGTRALPLATGVIDAAAFLGALQSIGYDGPVRAEPFSQALNELPDEEAVAQTAAAMQQAFALIS